MNDVLMDYALLVGRIKDKYQTHELFAKDMGMSKSGLSAKLNNHRAFTTDEIVRACELLDITGAEINSFFFQLKVAKRQQ